MPFEMTIHNAGNNPSVDEFVREHLEDALEKFDQRIERLDVRIRDENGDKGGVDKLCVINASLARQSKVHVEARAADVRAAALQAIQRLERAVARHKDRNQLGKSVRHEAARRRPQRKSA